MKEFAKQQQDFDAAEDKFYELVEQARKAKKTVDPKLDPAIKFKPIFVRIAKKAIHDPGGAGCEYMVMQTAREDRKEIQASFDRTMTFHLDHTLIQSDLYAIQEECRILSYGKSDGKYLDALRAIDKKSKLIENKAGALVALGEYTGSSYSNPHKDPKQAAQIFRQVVARYPSTKGAKRATSSLFEMENLQVGMVAPDLEQTDQDGKSWKLSEYRGQVIVLDFWGFW